MNNYLKQYRLTLRTVGPVFIGSGEVRTAKEYYQASQSVYFPDMAKLYADLSRRGEATAFEAFMMNTASGHNQPGQRVQAATRLNEFLSRHGIKQPDTKAWGGYGVKLGEIERAKSRWNPQTRQREAGEEQKLNDIHTFIKNAFGQPYVPGSSVKGMLRTLLAEYVVLKKEMASGRPLTQAPSRANDPRAGQRLEEGLFRTLAREDTRPDDAVNDALSMLRVSDSAPLTTLELAVVQKIDANTSDDPTGLPLFRECLVPGTEIHIDITLDTSHLAKVGDSDLTALIAHLQTTASTVYKYRHAGFLSKFHLDRLKPSYIVAEEGSFVYLGGGAGYRSKTVVNDQDTMARILNGQFYREAKKQGVPHVEKTKRTGVSPLVVKLTKLGGRFYEMGKCELSIEPIQQ